MRPVAGVATGADGNRNHEALAGFQVDCADDS